MLARARVCVCVSVCVSGIYTDLDGRGIKIFLWKRLKKAVSSSQGQLVAHNRNTVSPSTPSICQERDPSVSSTGSGGTQSVVLVVVVHSQ